MSQTSTLLKLVSSEIVGQNVLDAVATRTSAL